MTTTNPAPSSSGNALADLVIGAVAGAAAVWVMDRVDNFNFRHEDPAARQRTEAVRPDGQPPAQVMVAQIADRVGRPLSRERIDRIGQGAHYMIGIAPAMLYSMLGARYPAITRGRGAAFGLGLFVVQDELVNPLMGWSARPTAYPWQAHARGLVAHLVYGLVADAAVRALKARRRGHDRSADERHPAVPVDEAPAVREHDGAVVAPLQAAPPQPASGPHGVVGSHAP